MAVYIFAQGIISDREEFKKYESGFMKVFSKYSGKILSVDENPILMEGNFPYTRTALMEFPSKELALEWYNSDEYQQLIKHRLDASDGNLVMVHGLNN